MEVVDNNQLSLVNFNHWSKLTRLSLKAINAQPDS